MQKWPGMIYASSHHFLDEVTALEKEITVLRAEKEQERSGLTKASAVNGSSNHVLGRSRFCCLCAVCAICAHNWVLGLVWSLQL